ncbi:MAG: virulence RhuM family protein [Methanomassiliicoccaceae archaeon]|nr:virulence RhuM family protein [Methanomassiliicoccaceae archaeon]
MIKTEAFSMNDDEKRIRIRNSTSDFLIFSKENGGDGVDVLLADETVWLTQRSLCSLYDAAKSTVSEHLTTIFKNGELCENSVVRKFRTPAVDGKLYEQSYYNLQAIIALGFKVNSDKAIRFRSWAADVLADFALKGYVLDKERLKNDGIFSQSYFERLLEDIREIRISERKFYQKITDIYATSFDYDPNRPLTASETLSVYRSRNTIESSFRDLKHGIDWRPARCTSKDAIRGRILISFLALFCMSMLRFLYPEFKTKTAGSISEELSAFALTVTDGKGDGKRRIWSNFTTIIRRLWCGERPVPVPKAPEQAVLSLFG